jgi:site-specific DNA-methyltransferase (adenine-specific)
MINLICGKFEEIEIKNKIDLSFHDFPDNEKVKYENYDDNLKIDDYINLLNIWIKKACLATSGPVFISFSQKYTYFIEQIIVNNNIPLIQRIYWHFTFGQANKKRYTPSLRPIYWLNSNIIYEDKIKVPSQRIIKYNDKRANPLGKLPDNLWEFSRVCGTFKQKRKFHKNQFPEKLMERIILGHSKENDTILDGFLGSGTTAIVCQKLNRNCIGIDCSQFYIDKIKEIINQ